VKLRLAALAAFLLLGACRHAGDITAENGGGVYAVRNACPIPGIPAGTGDITLFNPPGSTDSRAIDVTASISAAVRGTNDHLAIGIGGTRQAVLAAAALRCLGGELQAQLWPTRRDEIAQAHEHGIDDVNRVFTIDDLAPQEVIVVATGVSNGDLLRGVRFLADSARTHTLVMCTRCNWVRFVDGIHFFARERREQVRLS